jgi:predicted CXXCH cytochrome family protein
MNVVSFIPDVWILIIKFLVKDLTLNDIFSNLKNIRSTCKFFLHFLNSGQLKLFHVYMIKHTNIKDPSPLSSIHVKVYNSLDLQITNIEKHCFHLVKVRNKYDFKPMDKKSVSSEHASRCHRYHPTNVDGLVTKSEGKYCSGCDFGIDYNTLKSITKYCYFYTRQEWENMKAIKKQKKLIPSSSSLSPIRTPSKKDFKKSSVAKRLF